MKQLIESRMTIYDVIDYINTEQNEIIIEAGWHSYSLQPNIKMIEQPMIYGQEAIISSIIDEKIFSALGNINHSFKQIITVTPKPNSYLGALVNEKDTMIHLPRKSKYIIYSWDNNGHLIKFESSFKDRLVVIGKGIAFSIMSESTLNPPLLFFFNTKPQNSFFKIKPSMDSNNPKSKYFI